MYRSSGSIRIDFHSDLEIEMDPIDSRFQIANRKNGRRTTSESIQSVWWRRPEKAQFDEHVPRHLHRFLEEEYWSCLHSIVACLENRDVLFVSHPLNIRRARNKTRQQIVAQNAGLKVAPQRITNSRKSLLEFVDSQQDCVIKPLCSTQDIEFDGVTHGIYCNPFNPSDLTDEVGVDLHLLQERLTPIREARVTCFGKTCHAVAIEHSSGAKKYEVDWRRMEIDEMRFPVIHDFPLEDECFAYLRHYGLNFGAFDFIETKEGFYFLECNQNGQWMFCDLEGEAGLVDSFVSMLVEGKSEPVAC